MTLILLRPQVWVIAELKFKPLSVLPQNYTHAMTLNWPQFRI